MADDADREEVLIRLRAMPGCEHFVPGLRWILKRALRDFRIRCVSVERVRRERGSHVDHS